MFPGMMFNVAKEHMETTRLWKIVLKMPKGSLLHCHLGAMVDLQWVFTAALEEPGMCVSASEPLTTAEVRDKAGLSFSHSKEPNMTAASIWSSDYTPGTLVPLTAAADSYPDGGREGWVAWMKERCSITQSESLQHHLGVDDVWRKLNSAFAILPGIVYYEPILRNFLQEFFHTLLKDGVRWLEFRTAPFSRFVLKDQEKGCGEPGELLRVITEEIKAFQNGNGGKAFWGVRMIWVGMRSWDTDAVVTGKLLFLNNRWRLIYSSLDMKDCIRLKHTFPDLISGYDLVGQEDAGRTLQSLTPELLWFQAECKKHGLNIPFFFQ